MYNDGRVVYKLWAVVDECGCIMFSRGGSSSTPKIMVYESEAKAVTALNNKWTQQAHKGRDLYIKLVYKALGNKTPS